MRILAAALAGLLVLAGPTLAETLPEAPPPEAEAPAPSRAEQLDTLFETLKTARDADAGKTAETAITQLWLKSGSDTIDLLMGWSLEAIQQKDFAVALDFLDSVTTQKPDYAEGWNKRATVYFLLNDYGKSISDIRRTLALEPRHFGALSGLGTILSGLGDRKRAIDAYRQALAINPFLEKVREALDKLENEASRDI